MLAEAAAGGPKAGKARRLLDKRGSKDDTGLQGWARKKYRVVRHAAHGILNRVAKVCVPHTASTGATASS